MWLLALAAPAERAHVTERWQAQLAAMADDREAAIDRWVAERLGDGSVIASSADTAALVSTRPTSEGATGERAARRARVEAMLASAVAAYGYRGVAVLQPDDGVLAQAGTPWSRDPDCFALVRASLDSGSPAVDFHLHGGTTPLVQFVVPIRLPADPRPTGAVTLTAEPAGWLYPFLAHQPVPSATVETVLMRRDGAAALFLTPLRHRPDPPMTLRRPIADPGFAAAAALTGQRGFTGYTDYRGVPVLAATRRLAAAPWGMVTKVDRAEALAPYRDWLARAAVGSAAVLLALVAAAYAVWRRQISLEREAVAEGERRLGELMLRANDAVLVSSNEGQVLQANLRAEEIYGYPQDALCRMNVRDLRAPALRAGAPPGFDEVSRSDGLTFESLHCRRDGSTFPVEVSVRHATLRDRRYLVATVRDITAHKQSEERVRRLNLLLRTISELNQLIVRERNRDELLRRACRVLVEHGGFRLAWIGFADEASATVAPAAAAGAAVDYLAQVTIRSDDSPLGRGPTGTALRELRAVVANDWTRDETIAPWREAGLVHGLRSSASFPIPTSRAPAGVLTVYSDQTDAFDDEIAELMSELANDIAFALDAHHAEAQRQAAERALAESELRFRRMFEQTPLGYQSLDEEGRILDVNPAWLQLLGYRREEVIGRWFGELLAETSVDRFRAAFPRFRERGEVHNIEFEILRKDGTRISASFDGRIGHDENGRFRQTHCLLSDVSERRRAEAALAESQRLMQDVLDSSAAVTYVIDLEGRIAFANSRLEEVLGATRDALRGKTRHEVMPREVADQHRANDLKVAAEGRALSFEETNLEADGVHVYSTVKFPLRDLEGRVYAVAGMSSDVTAERQAQAAAERERTFSQAALDSLPGLFYLFDERGRFIRWNRNFEAKSGYSADELRRLAPTDLFGDDARDAVAAAIAQVLAEGEATVAAEFLSRDGTRSPHLFTGTRFVYEGTPCVIGMGIDITDRRRAEEALRQSERRLAAILENVQDAYVRVDLEGRLVMTSPSTARMYGYPSPEAMIGMPAAALYADPGERDSVVEEVRRHGRVHDRVGRGRRRDGSEFWVSLNTQFVRDAAGRVVGTEGFVRDVTERVQAQEALRESEDRFKYVFDHSRVGKSITRPSGELEVNQAFADLLGYSREELRRLRWQEVTHPDDIEPTSRELAPLVSGERESARFVKRYLRRDGAVVWADVATSLRRDGDGKPLYFITSINDITERRLAEARLRAVNDLQERLLQPAPIADKLRVVTDAVVRLVGADFARVWLIGPGDRCESGCVHAPISEGPHACRDRRSCLHLRASSGRHTHTEGGAHARVPIGAYKIGLIASGELPGFITNDAAADPRVHDRAWARELGLKAFAGYRLALADGEPLGVLALFSQRTISPEEDALVKGIAHATSLSIQEARAAERLRQSEERFRATFEQAAVGVAHVSLAGGWERVNRRLCDIVGYSHDELLRLTFQDITHPDDLDADLEQVGRLLAGEIVTYSMEKRYIRKDGSPVWINLTASLVRDARGAPDYFIAVVEDIAERKLARDELARAHDELERRVVERTAALAASNRELESFAYSVSHDLRVPLRAIDGFSRLLAEENAGSMDQEGLRLLGVVREQTQRMGKLIDDLLAFSRLGRVEMRQAQVDMSALAASAIDELTLGQPRLADVELGGLPAARGDAAMLRQVWLNLLSNALKFCPAGQKPRIEIGATRSPGEIVYFVRDHGVGFDMKYVDKLFGVFQRLHSSRDFPGTGVGLALVWRVVHRHGGRVWAQGEPGRGATISFALPTAGEEE